MASSNLSLSVWIFLFAVFFTGTESQSPNSTSLDQRSLSSIKGFCTNTPYPDLCFDSLKLGVSINISPNVLGFLIQTLSNALSEAEKLTPLFTAGNLVERQRGAVRDCSELHWITMSAIRQSVSRVRDGGRQKLADARAYLSAALTNTNTCLEGLDSASGPLKPKIVNSITATYEQVRNSLSVLSRQKGTKKSSGQNRRLLGFPRWVSRETRRVLETSGQEYDRSQILTVASDGSGNFSTVSDAISFAPNNSADRVIVYVREGVYYENVEIPSYKTNIVLIGDGTEVTFITGNRSVGDGWTTFRSATLAVSGEGFLARDITIDNTAGPAKHQAVALRVNADFAAFYRCAFDGYQDTLYVHSFRQFYRECDIFGTVDYIFGNAAVVFQACNIVSKAPMRGQFTVVTAQSRETPEEDTGMSIHNCSILAMEDLWNSSFPVKSYLGRPWRAYSRTVYMESYIDGFIDPAGWTPWSGDEGLDTLYYGEYENSGPGSGTEGRVSWPGFHVMRYDDAYNFTVSEFITRDEWLDSTDFPYDAGI